MTIAGSIYGVVLNDRDEIARLGGVFEAAPYRAAPQRPVVYIKPRLCATTRGAPVPCPDDVDGVICSATLALLFARDASKITPAEAETCVGATALALDVSLPQSDYYRPAVAQLCRDGFLPLAEWCPPHFPDVIETLVDGQVAGTWRRDRLVRSVTDLIADLSQFMTLMAGDVLLVGLQGQAVGLSLGQSLSLRAAAMPGLTTRLERTAT